MIAGLSAEKVVELAAVLISLVGIYFILKKDFKRYGLLLIISRIVGTILCLLFVLMGFYSFPVKIVPLAPIPVIEMFTVVPYYVLLGVRYSPVKWGWKIPFYWGMVHIAMLLEILVLYHPVKIIHYDAKWDVWDSYTWW